MRTLHQDYETYFGPAKGYDGRNMTLSLRNKDLAMTDYVRHPEFEVHCVGVRWDDESTPMLFRQDEIGEWYGNVDWEDTHVVAHNAHFEGIINHTIYDVHPGRYSCTMAMSECIYQGAFGRGLDELMQIVLGKAKLPHLKIFRGLHTKDITPAQWNLLATYCLNDIDGSSGLYHAFRGQIPEEEHELASHTIQLFADPVLHIDVPMAKAALSDAIEERKRLIDLTGHTEQEISGDISFAELLRTELGYIPQKLSPTTHKLTYAFAKTDKEFVKLKTHASPRVRNLVTARSEVGSTLGITRARRMIRTGTTGDYLFAVALHMWRAHTLRWAGGNKMNQQNFTSGGKLRKSITAPPGYVIVVVDSSQIEARNLASAAKQENLLEMFREKRDPYNELASDIFPDGPFEKDSDERFVGKTAQLGLGYQMGAKKFHNMMVTGARGRVLDIELDFAYKVVNIFRSKYSKIPQLWKDAEACLEWMATHDKGTRTLCDGVLEFEAATNRMFFPNGLYLRYPDLEATDDGLTYKVILSSGNYVTRNIYGGAFVENFIQSWSRHIVAPQILEIANRYRICMLTHDECSFLALEREADEALAFGLRAFRRNPSWCADIPLDAEGGYDYCYSK